MLMHYTFANLRQTKCHKILPLPVPFYWQIGPPTSDIHTIPPYASNKLQQDQWHQYLMLQKSQSSSAVVYIWASNVWYVAENSWAYIVNKMSPPPHFPQLYLTCTCNTLLGAGYLISLVVCCGPFCVNVSPLNEKGALGWESYFFLQMGLLDRLQNRVFNYTCHAQGA